MPATVAGLDHCIQRRAGSRHEKIDFGSVITYGGMK